MSGEDQLQPLSIEREDASTIRIRWSDGSEASWTAARLRASCPCATCREKKRGRQQESDAAPRALPVLSAAEARPLRIESMRPVGNYAYNITFSDGHHSGIFPLELLHDPSRR